MVNDEDDLQEPLKADGKLEQSRVTGTLIVNRGPAKCGQSSGEARLNQVAFLLKQNKGCGELNLHGIASPLARDMPVI
jgi:hypothetical protein